MKGGNFVGKVLSAILIVVVIGALGIFGDTLAAPTEERFTEFYIVGAEGRATSYPRDLVVGREIISGFIFTGTRRQSFIAS